MFIIRIAIIAAGAYILFAGFLFVFQSRYIYFPERICWLTPAASGLISRTSRLKPGMGLGYPAGSFPAKVPGAWFYSVHGNAGNISHRLESIQIFHRLGLSVFIFDYRGYGQSEGRPTEQGTYADAEAAWRYLVEERRINPNESSFLADPSGARLPHSLPRATRQAPLSSSQRSPPFPILRLPYIPTFRSGCYCASSTTRWSI